MSCAFALRVDLEWACLTLSGGKGVRELWGTVSGAFALRVDLGTAFLTLREVGRSGLPHNPLLPGTI